MNFISIGNRRISSDSPPYVIAELSANHDGSLDRALRLIEEAKESGADAVKLQTYKPDTITLRSDAKDFMITGGLWDGRSLYDLYEEAHMPWEWHSTLFNRAADVGIEIFSSPFDATAVDFLEGLNAPAYKIASFEAIDLPLIKYVAGTRKPMIISTGMANAEEIAEAVAAAEDGGCRQIALLHCVSGYPAPAAEYNLRTIADMAQRFGRVVGLSDHTLSGATAIAAIAMGACIVEKHFTLDRSAGGPDDSFSMEPSDLRELCYGVRTAWESLGKVNYACTASESVNAKFRRSLYFTQNLAAGSVIGPESVRSVRPGFGLPPKHLPQLLGKRVSKDVLFGQAVTWDTLEPTALG